MRVSVNVIAVRASESGCELENKCQCARMHAHRFPYPCLNKIRTHFESSIPGGEKCVGLKRTSLTHLSATKVSYQAWPTSRVNNSQMSSKSCFWIPRLIRKFSESRNVPSTCRKIFCIACLSCVDLYLPSRYLSLRLSQSLSKNIRISSQTDKRRFERPGGVLVYECVRACVCVRMAWVRECTCT